MVELTGSGMDPCQQIPPQLTMLVAAAAGDAVASRLTAAVAHIQESPEFVAGNRFLLDFATIATHNTAISDSAGVLDERRLRPIMQPVGLAR